jgi:urease accessory protein
VVPTFRLFQLISPSLPVGAFAYSQGLEWAVESGWINDQASFDGWLRSQLTECRTSVEL